MKRLLLVPLFFVLALVLAAVAYAGCQTHAKHCLNGNNTVTTPFSLPGTDAVIGESLANVLENALNGVFWYKDGVFYPSSPPEGAVGPFTLSKGACPANPSASIPGIPNTLWCGSVGQLDPWVNPTPDVLGQFFKGADDYAAKAKPYAVKLALDKSPLKLNGYYWTCTIPPGYTVNDQLVVGAGGEEFWGALGQTYLRDNPANYFLVLKSTS